MIDFFFIFVKLELAKKTKPYKYERINIPTSIVFNSLLKKPHKTTEKQHKVLHTMSYSKGDVALAIVLTFAAGLSTVIGASVSFCVKPHFVEILPIALAFSAGVMIYVSFVEIIGKGLEAFENELESKHPDKYEFLAHIYISLTFFGGIIIGYILDFIVHLLGYKDDLLHDKDVQQYNNGDIRDNNDSNVSFARVPSNTNNTKTINDDDDDNDIQLQEINMNDGSEIEQSTGNDEDTMDGLEQEESKNLIKTSLITALAISLHNFPEGVATFVSTLANPTLGVSVAVAIAIHNIPEGIAVAMPIYFATKSKWKAFLWSFLSGIAEPIGGLIGYAVIANMFSDTVFGVLFGFTAGIMIYISFKELLPTARKRDKDDKYTSKLLFAGFLVMDISLVLFKLV